MCLAWQFTVLNYRRFDTQLYSNADVMSQKSEENKLDFSRSGWERSGSVESGKKEPREVRKVSAVDDTIGSTHCSRSRVRAGNETRRIGIRQPSCCLLTPSGSPRDRFLIARRIPSCKLLADTVFDSRKRAMLLDPSNLEFTFVV